MKISRIMEVLSVLAASLLGARAALADGQKWSLPYDSGIAATNNGLVRLWNNGTGPGLWVTGAGMYSVLGETYGNGIGVYAFSLQGYGLEAISKGSHAVYALTQSGGGDGVHGESFSGNGVYGYAWGTNYGVYGEATGGSGVCGRSRGSSPGVLGIGDRGDGVLGNAFGEGSVGVRGLGYYGLEGNGGEGGGVWATSSKGPGVLAYSKEGVAVSGTSEDGDAASFQGSVKISGDLAVAGTKSFVIDHPLDPAHKYLYHAAVESPDRRTIYDGVVTTDGKGEATIALPAYFEALNGDYRYQLTVVGQPSQAFVSSEIRNNRFSVKTDRSSVKISWQVTGIRRDPYARLHPMQVEVDKPAAERGRYLAPEAYGQPREKGVNYEGVRAARARFEAAEAQRLRTQASTKP